MADSDALDPCAPWDPNGMGVYLTAPSFRYSNIAKELTEGQEVTCILSAGMKFLYVLPGFDVLGIELRHIKVKGFGKTGNEEDTFDMFIKNDISLLRSYPAALIIKDLAVVMVLKIQYVHLYIYNMCIYI